MVSFSQNTSDIQLNDWFCCNLNDVLSDLSKSYDIKFDYDEEKLKSMQFMEDIKGQTLEEFLVSICEKNKLKYYVGKDSVVYIINKKETVNNKHVQIQKTDKKFTGPPTQKNVSLSGRIVDKNTGESIPFATVFVKNSSMGTTSNVDGYFTILGVPTDTSTIGFSYLGYEKKEIYLQPGLDLKNILVELAPEVHSINEVTIKAEKQDVLQISGQQAGLIKMSPLKLGALPNLGEKDILRSFQLMPGISAANENSSGLYVRGGTPDQVLVLYDGFTVYNVEHMFGFFSAFNSNAIKDVQLYKSGFDARYGGRLASVVEITGKEGNQKEFNAMADFSLMSINGFIEFPVGKKVSVIVAGRRSWKSPLYNKIFDQFTDENEQPMGGMSRPGGGGITTEQETSSYFYDINGKITYRPSKKDKIALSIYNGKDDLDNSIEPEMSSRFGGGNFSMSMETIDKTEWGNTGVSFNWTRQHSSRLYIKTLLSYSNYFSLRERSTSGFRTNQDGEQSSISRGLNEDNNLLDFTGKTDIEYKLSDKNIVQFGLQITHNSIDYSYMQNDTIEVIYRNTTGQIHSAYLQDKFQFFNNKLSFSPGMRYNYFSGTNKSYIEPRINAMYKITKKLSLKGAAGNYYQYAKRVIREDITQGSRDFWVLSDNDQLPVSSSIQYALGFTWETPKYLFDVEGYYKDLKNITEYSLRVEAQRNGVDYSENFFTGTGKAKGIDFLVQKKSGNLTGWIGYTIGQVTNNIPEFGDYDYYASNDVTHEFKTVATYKWKKWEFGANWIFTTGKPYTSPEGGYQLTLLDGTTADYINVSVKNGNRLPKYHRLDLSGKLNFALFERFPSSISLSVFNVYNRANVWYNEYEIEENDVFEVPVYYLGITPNLNLTIKLK